jgi:hypothetical protein
MLWGCYLWLTVIASVLSAPPPPGPPAAQDPLRERDGSLRDPLLRASSHAPVGGLGTAAGAGSLQQGPSSLSESMTASDCILAPCAPFAKTICSLGPTRSWAEATCRVLNRALTILAGAVVLLTAVLCVFVHRENRGGECWGCATKHGSGSQ